jgi:2-(1,2-epoxy-1,2-dihydrophenyl)acetyl-CoA isomerase
VDACGQEDAVRAIVITGAGKAFSSGDDIIGGMGEPSRKFIADVGIGTDLGPHHAMVKKLLSVPKPVVAAVNGRCHGAGWVIALACDFRVMRSDALIGDIRAGKAIFSAQGVPIMLPRLIGASRAMDILINARVLEADEAERIGLAVRVWSPERFEAELAGFTGALAAGPTRSYAAWKLAVNRSLLAELDGYTDWERRVTGAVKKTEDSAEGRLAFKEKRKPRFNGR